MRLNRWKELIEVVLGQHCGKGWLVFFLNYNRYLNDWLSY